MSGTYHPPGCRCPGCLPGQYVMRPASPARQPATSNRRPAQPRSGGDAGIILPVLLIGTVAVVVLGWPAFIFHGEGGPAGTSWEWNIDTTVALAVYWGFLIAAGLVIWLSRKYAQPGLPPGWRPPAAPQAPPLCAHGNAVPVDSTVTGQVLAWLCPDCEKQLDAGFRASELRPDGSWPPVRRRP